MNIKTIYYFSLLLSAVSAMQNTADLIKAAKDGNLGDLRILIDHGADVNTTDKDGWPLLIFAVWGENPEVVRLLLANGADPKLCVPQDGRTALMEASSMNHVDMVNLLIKHGANVNAKNHNGFTALVSAARDGHKNIATALLEAGADPNAKDNYGRTPLDYAATGNPEFVTFLEEAMQSAFNDAVNEGNLDKVVTLATNVDVNVAGENGFTALMLAAYTGNMKAVEFLLQNGAVATATDDEGDTALDWAKDEATKALLRKHGAQTGAKLDEAAFIDAVKEGNLDKVVTLATDVDVNVAIDNGYTALMVAAWKGNMKAVESLLKNGAVATVKDNAGETALEWAETGGHEEIENLLKKAIAATVTRRRLVLGEHPVSTLVLGIAVSLLLLGYLIYQFKRLTAKRQPADTDLPADLESGLAAI